MTTVNYPSPILVNGYSCKNCTDVDNAKRHIDPAHPKDGPYGVNRRDRPGETRPSDGFAKSAVVLAGGLAGLSAGLSAGDKPAAPPPETQGVRVDLKV